MTEVPKCVVIRWTETCTYEMAMTLKEAQEFIETAALPADPGRATIGEQLDMPPLKGDQLPDSLEVCAAVIDAWHERVENELSSYQEDTFQGADRDIDEVVVE